MSRIQAIRNLGSPIGALLACTMAVAGCAGLPGPPPGVDPMSTTPVMVDPGQSYEIRGQNTGAGGYPAGSYPAGNGGYPGGVVGGVVGGVPPTMPGPTAPPRFPMQPAGQNPPAAFPHAGNGVPPAAANARGQGQVGVTAFQQPPPNGGTNSLPAPQPGGAPLPADGPSPWAGNNQVIGPGSPGALNMPDYFGSPIGAEPTVPGTPVPVDIYVQEARTGRFMFGVGVNSSAGLTGQIVIDERNFDLFRFPRSVNDLVQGGAFRGRGQGFRIEAAPGSQVQRYLISLTEPYLFDTPVSLNVSGFLFNRRYQDWDEERLGGRLALGYRLTPDLSVSAALRAEGVEITNPVAGGVPELDAALGRHELYSGRLTLAHDTRDTPFLATEGHFIEMSFEQVFGSFDYPRAELDYRRYFLVRERPDGSGRHTLSFTTSVGFTGSQTPIFENYFAGGFSTLRGFEFRGASPTVGPVQVGGEFRLLGSVEYLFPLTADDMVRGVVFCDFGTVEEKVQITGEDFRVAPGAGLRIAIPALGPAPLALDLAFPIAREDTDQVQNFSFFIGFGRG